MAVLSDRDIIETIKSGRIKVDPFDSERVQAGSLEMCMGFEVREFVDSKRFDLEKNELESRTRVLKIDYEGYFLRPHELVLAKTYESLKISDDLIGWIEGRSSFAKMGLMVHVSSGFIHPGSEGHQILELYNFHKGPIKLHPKLPMCQVIFEETKSRAAKPHGAVREV
ncbi:MAG: dCTP deaminase [Candidatus Aenigmarchaeota archaeon]|nr:dCTP deaminase [Candidatus Aenigmarchaeota archaeon]